MPASSKSVLVDDEPHGDGKSAFGVPAANNPDAAVVQVAKVTSIQAANSSTQSEAGNSSNSSETTASQNNLIKRTVDEIYEIMAEVHDIREELLAHGIHFHKLNAIIEIGKQDKPDELRAMTDSALEASIESFGPNAIKRDELETHLAEIIDLEKDLGHVRRVAKQQGVHMQALNHLTALMRLNPGDKGVQAINTFVAYADAAGVSLERMDAIRQQFKEGPKSVLPDVPRELATSNRDDLKHIATNVVLGCVLTCIMMWFVL